MRDPFLPTSDGTRLFHLDWDRGAPVVFVHAWSRSTYQGQAAPYFVRLHQQRGQGFSGGPALAR